MKYITICSALILGLFIGGTKATARQSDTRNKSSNAYRNSYKRISAGTGWHTLEIRGGALYGWGFNNHGQLGNGSTTDAHTPVQVLGGTNWTTVAEGEYHSLGIKSDGTLWAWGDNFYGGLGIGNTVEQWAPVQVGSDNKWVAVAGGLYFSLGIKSDGTLWAWGFNGYGQLGQGNTTQQNSPVQVGNDNHWASVCCTQNSTMALKTDGSLWVWGDNTVGQLGIGNTIQQNSPVQAGIGSKWVNISGGRSNMLTIRADGTLWGSGQNGNGELGMGNYAVVNVLTQSGTDTDWVRVGAGQYHTIALKANGTLWGWGGNTHGATGTGVSSNVPIQVGTAHNWTDVASGGSIYSIAIKAGGQIYGWGPNNYGQLGIGNNLADQFVPVATSTPAIEWINISTGGSHTVGVRSEGTLWVWGHNSSGQLGTGNILDMHFPHQMDLSTDWVGVAAGSVHTLAMKANGTLWAWGGNTTGQLGNGNNSDQHSPVQLGNDTNWVSISAGRGHSVGLKSNGTIWTWGLNTYGQLGNGNNSNTNTPAQVGSDHDWIAIQAGSDHTIALKADGTLWAWGYNLYGQLGTGNNTDSNVPVQVGAAGDWVAIAAGGYHSLAIKANGRLWSWGYNLYGQLGIGNNTNMNSPQQVGTDSTWLGVTAGEEHSFAFRTDGTAMSWGMNTYGQLGLNNNTDYNSPQPIPAQSGVIQLFCGSEGMHSTLIKDARDLVCLAGLNTYGQLGDNSVINKNNYNCITICNPVTPTLTLSASPNDTICGTQAITFTATVSNEGPSPSYQWYKNGFPVGTNLASFTENSPVNNDVFVCMLTSTAPCAYPLTAADTLTVVVNNNISGLLAGSPANTEATTWNISAPVDVRYYADCDLMASITPSGASPLNGNTTVKVTLDNVVNNYNSQPYVQRHFDIEPANNAANATADIRLYAYQSEFDAYNTAAATAGLPLLPTGAVDNGNVRISQFHGIGTQPANYPGTEVLITPTVSWDAVNNWWVMDFPVTGFSGFYIHTAWGPDPLAIKLSDIAARNVGAANRIDWNSSSEEEGDTYTLQRSADGRTFSDLATLPAKGRASAYSYLDEQPYNGISYYRVLLRDVAGNMAYSKVVSAAVQNGTGFDITVAPNPAHSSITVRSYGLQQASGTITISDMTGRALLQQQATGNSSTLDISTLPQGIYMLRYSSDAGSRSSRFEKTKE